MLKRDEQQQEAVPLAQQQEHTTPLSFPMFTLSFLNLPEYNALDTKKEQDSTMLGVLLWQGVEDAQKCPAQGRATQCTNRI